MNALFDAEADRLSNARRYQLRVQKLRAQTFETAIIERYRRRENSDAKGLIEMCLAGVSVWRVEGITEKCRNHLGQRRAPPSPN